MKKLLFLLIALLLVLITPVLAEGQKEDYGTLYAHTLCQQNIFSKEVLYQFHGGDWTDTGSFLFDSSGKYDGPFNPGEYDLQLLDGNANHPEYRTVTITAGETTRIWFIGQAVSHSHKPETIPEPSPTPSDNCQWVTITESIYHLEVNHTEWIGEINHTVHHDVVTHEVYHPAITKVVHHPAITHKEYRYYIEGHCEPCGYRHCEWVDGHWSDWSRINPHKEGQQSRIITDIPAWDEMVIIHPAWMETVIDSKAYDEIVVDVPGYPVLIVDKEAYTETIEHQVWQCGE